jgi:hypothetical protein
MNTSGHPDQQQSVELVYIPTAAEDAAVIIAEPVNSPSDGEPAASDAGKLARLRDLGESTAHHVQEGAGKAGDVAKGVVHRVRRSPDYIRPLSEYEVGTVRFSDGAPKPNVVYARDPAAPDLYHPLAQYHRKVREHKLGELVKLLTGLGADHIVVECEATGTHKVRVSIPGLPLKVGSKREHGHHLLFETHLHPRHKPHVPEGLHWLAQEKVWQELADSRLIGNASDWNAQIELKSDREINADLCTRIGKKGFGIGGSYADLGDEAWSIRATFAPSRRGLW